MRARMLANASLPDRIVGGLTARQLGLLAVTVVASWGIFSALSVHVPLAVAGVVCLPLASAGVAVALGQVDGMSLDRLALLAIRYLRRPRRRVLVSGPVPAPPSWAGRRAELAPVAFPVEEVLDEGLLSLGDEGLALVCRASPVNLALRSEKEQEAVIEAFGRYLNSLTQPLEILVRSRRPDLEGRLRDLEQRIPSLPHPSLEEQARRHIDYLRFLSSRTDVVRREAFICLREKTQVPDGARLRLRRRFDEASALLRAAGVHFSTSSDAEARTLLATMTDRDGFLPNQVGPHQAAAEATWR